MLVLNYFKETMTNQPWMGTLEDELFLNNTSEEGAHKDYRNSIRHLTQLVLSASNSQKIHTYRFNQIQLQMFREKLESAYMLII